MPLLGFGGNKRVAQTLARAGWKLSKEFVRRARKETPPVRSVPEGKSLSGRRVHARYSNHIFMADLTDVPGLFGLFSFKVALVLDVFSRMPLAAAVFVLQPSAHAIGELFQWAVHLWGLARHFVSDQASHFTAQPFRETLDRLHVRQRFGAVGETGSIAVIERLWRTLKDMLSLRPIKPLLREDLERRLELVLTYFAHHRPRQGLGGATPAEIYFGIPPAHLSAAHPPRARPGEGPTESPFDVRGPPPD